MNLIKLQLLNKILKKKWTKGGLKSNHTQQKGISNKFKFP